MHRRVPENRDPLYRETELDDDGVDIVDSEDFSFCRKAREAGFSVWLDTDQVRGHFKTLDMQRNVLWAQEHADRQRICGLGLWETRGPPDERSETTSLSDAERFLQRLAQDPDLAKKDAAAHRRELVELAHESGFDSTEELPRPREP